MQNSEISINTSSFLLELEKVKIVGKSHYIDKKLKKWIALTCRADYILNPEYLHRKYDF